MRLAVALLVILPWLSGGVSRAAEQWAILDVAAVPYLTSQGRDSYQDFLLMDVPRAMAVASHGQYGWYGGGHSIEDARARALKSCADKGGTDCAIYAEDLQVVWQGRAPQKLPSVPGPLIATRDYAFAPDTRFFWWGPQSARGVLVWGHGKGNGYDGRGQQPPDWVRAFNNGGFDIVRFEREPFADTADAAAEWLRKGLTTLRARGWRMVVVAGQSRGAWNSLQVLDTPGLADAVIAVSPASFSSQGTQEADLFRILHGIRASTARVAVAQFKGDVICARDAGSDRYAEHAIAAAGRGRAGDRPAGGHLRARRRQFGRLRPAVWPLSAAVCHSTCGAERLRDGRSLLIRRPGGFGGFRSATDRTPPGCRAPAESGPARQNRRP